MFVLIIAGCFAAFFFDQLGPVFEHYHPAATVLGAIVCVLATPAVGAILKRRFSAVPFAATTGDFGLLRRYRASLWGYRLWALAMFMVIVYVLQWPRLVHDTLHLARVPLIREAAGLAPFVLVLVAHWIPLFALDPAARRARCRLADYLSYHLRNHVLIIIIPYVFFFAVLNTLDGLPWAYATVLNTPPVQIVTLVVIVSVFIFAAPFFLRLVWLCRKLPAGPLRDDLEAITKKYGHRQRDILVWETHGLGIANACVTGLAGPARYIFITDGLLNNFSREEVVAVFGHELGHVHFRHIQFYVLYVVFFWVIMQALESALGSLSGILPLGVVLSGHAGTVVFAGLFLAYWGGLFGYISRRFERQADVFGAFVCGSFDVFIRALGKISFLNGIPPNARNWRHFSIRKRCEYLAALARNPALLDRLERSITVTVFSVMSVGTASLAFVAAGLVRQLV